MFLNTCIAYLFSQLLINICLAYRIGSILEPIHKRVPDFCLPLYVPYYRRLICSWEIENNHFVIHSVRYGAWEPLNFRKLNLINLLIHWEHGIVLAMSFLELLWGLLHMIWFLHMIQLKGVLGFWGFGVLGCRSCAWCSSWCELAISQGEVWSSDYGCACRGKLGGQRLLRWGC